MDYPSQVHAIFDLEISNLAQDVSRWCKRSGTDFTRNRKLPFDTLINTLVFMGSDCLKIELLRFFDFDHNAAQSSAFVQARKKLLPDALHELLTRLNGHFKRSDFQGMCPVACDGTTLGLPRCASETSTFYPPHKSSPRGHNAVHLTTLYDLGTKSYLDGVIQAEKDKNEFSGFCQMVDRWSYPDKPLFIHDRGIASYNVFAHIIEIGGSFVIRLDERKASRILGREIQADECFDVSVSRILSRSKAKSKRAQPQRKNDYRYIDSKTAFDYITSDNPEYEIDVRVVRFKLDDTNTYETIVTNLSEDKFCSQDLKEIYWMRWGIETSFCDLKYSIGASAPHSSKFDFVSQEIYARMILYNMCSAITAHAAKKKHHTKKTKHVYKVNFSLAIKICHDYFRRKRRQEKSPDIEKLIRRNLSPVRLGRIFERRTKFWVPPTFNYKFS